MKTLRKCKDCNWATRIKTYIYLCIFRGHVGAETNECENFKERER